ncbi:MAG: hypothetical protein F6J87_18350 [Spirulina sp. SIO3F2]|nr:hypothetical protein [Spirulina sp. SIO3F2]
MQQVSTITLGQFYVWWDEHPEQRLWLNFQPLIEHFDLSGQFCLGHWQAKPFGLRRWGIYEHPANIYTPMDYDQFLGGLYWMTFIQVPETQYRSSPSAVILFKNGRLKPLPRDRYTITTTLS